METTNSYNFQYFGLKVVVCIQRSKKHLGKKLTITYDENLLEYASSKEKSPLIIFRYCIATT